MNDPILYDPSILNLAGVPVTLPGPQITRAADPFAFYRITKPRPLGRTKMRWHTRRFVAKVEGWISLYRGGTAPDDILEQTGMSRLLFYAALRKYATTDYAAAWAAWQNSRTRRLNHSTAGLKVRDDIPWENLLPQQVKSMRRIEDVIRKMETMTMTRAAEEVGMNINTASRLVKKYMLFQYRPWVRNRKPPKPKKRTGRPMRAVSDYPLTHDDITAYREMKITQKALADKYGVSRHTMALWLLACGGKSPGVPVADAMGK